MSKVKESITNSIENGFLTCVFSFQHAFKLLNMFGGKPEKTFFLALLCVMFYCVCQFLMWFPGSDVVLDCIQGSYRLGKTKFPDISLTFP